jgi:hypothetical protein
VFGAILLPADETCRMKHGVFQAAHELFRTPQILWLPKSKVWLSNRRLKRPERQRVERIISFGCRQRL